MTLIQSILSIRHAVRSDYQVLSLPSAGTEKVSDKPFLLRTEVPAASTFATTSRDSFRYERVVFAHGLLDPAPAVHPVARRPATRGKARNR
jgi:hypothetical protein